jgi:thioredoxin 1
MAAKNIVTLTSQNFDTEVIKSEQPVLVDFWAEWCGPCKMLGPVLDELATEFDGRARIGKVNIDDHQDLAVQFGIQSIPTLLVFKGGQVVGQSVGAKPKAALRQVLDAAVK